MLYNIHVHKTLEKNFWAWLRIWTAVFVAMCSAAKNQDSSSSEPYLAKKSCVFIKAKSSFDPRINTFDLTPTTTIKLNGFKEPLVLFLTPFFSLLSYFVGFPNLEEQSTERSEKMKWWNLSSRFLAKHVPWQGFQSNYCWFLDLFLHWNCNFHFLRCCCLAPHFDPKARKQRNSLFKQQESHQFQSIYFKFIPIPYTIYFFEIHYINLFSKEEVNHRSSHVVIVSDFTIPAWKRTRK